MSRYILMPIAQQDLADIRDYYLEEAGYRVARQMVVDFVEEFRFLAGTPGIGHKREDLADAGLPHSIQNSIQTRHQPDTDHYHREGKPGYAENHRQAGPVTAGLGGNRWRHKKEV